MQFERLRKTEIQQAADLAARSFLDYAYFSIFVPNAKRRFRFLNTMLSVEFSVNDDRAELWAAKEDGKIVAVAMLCSPDYHKPTDSQYMKAGFWKVFLAGGIKAVSDWNAMDAEAGKPCHSRKDAWYLSLLTVDPQRKGQGIGSKMLQECIIPRIRQQGGKELTLFTNSEENRAFYQKNGLIEFHQTTISYRGKEMGSWSYYLTI